MRDHLAIIEDIDKFLTQNNLTSQLIAFQREVQASSTGSELCLRVGSWLKSADTDCLKGLKDEFLSYCRSNGLYPTKRH